MYSKDDPFCRDRWHTSMTTLLTHTVAYSTKPSFMPKTINQPPKKCLSLALSWAKMAKMAKFWAHFLLLTFLKTSIFKPLYFLKWRPIFDDFSSTECKTFLRGWLLVLGLKEGLVECATVCIKSVVILNVVKEWGIEEEEKKLTLGWWWV